MAKAVFGIVANDVQAIRVVERLKIDGFSNNDISVLLADKSGTRDFAVEHQTKAPEGAAAGAGAGALAGGVLGWLSGIGALAIPGFGPLIAAGPIMGALGGAAVGGTLGGIAGALIGMGLPEFEAQRYETKIKGGNALISVHSEDSDQTTRAKKIFEEEGATDISTAGEASVAKGERAATKGGTTVPKSRV